MKYVNLRILLLCSLSLFISRTTQAQDEKFKAVFIYNFIKYIKWPDQEGSFEILVLGNTPLINEITALSAKKTAANKPIEIVKINAADEIKSGQIIFIPNSKTDMLPEILQKARDKNLLIITERPNACKNGSCINFIDKNGKLSFEISKSNITSTGLEVNSGLLTMGIPVEN